MTTKPSETVLRFLYFNQWLTYEEIGKKYGVSKQTVHEWFKSYKIKARRSGSYHKIKKVNDEDYKFCRKGNHWVALKNFWKNKDGTIASECPDCHRARMNHEKTVPFKRIKFAVIELQRRLGKKEAERRCGFSSGYLKRYENGTYTNMRASTARRIIEALIEVRRKGIVRHKLSIKYGDALRGRPELVPVNSEDFYKSTGDRDSENRNKNRRKNLEATRQKERERYRRKKAAQVG